MGIYTRRAMCAICGGKDAIVGVLCDECQAPLISALPLAPEQLVAKGRGTTRASLIDRWGGTHRLAPVTHVGRVVFGDTLQVLTPSVSRRHAAITENLGQWFVSDLGSANGTFVDDVRVCAETAIRDGAIVRFGQVAFYFVDETPEPLAIARSSSKTIRPPSESEISRPTDEFAAPDGIEEVELRFEEPTGGGGAVMVFQGRSVQLTIAQYELVMLLVARLEAERDRDALTRGFVSSEDVLRHVSLRSDDARADHVRQLVLRLRRMFVKFGMDDVIESRHGYGYRLLVLPKR